MELNEVEIRIRFHEADPYSVAHHSRYFQWFDEGMLNFFENILDLGIEKMHGEGIFVPVIEDRCSYSKPGRFGDEIILRTLIEANTKPIFCMRHTFVNKKTGDRMAEGRSRHVFASRERVLMLRMPDFFRESLEASRTAHPECFA